MEEKISKLNYESKKKIFYNAAKNGEIETLKKFKAENSAEFILLLREDNYNAFIGASYFGQLDTLKWFKNEAPTEFINMVRAPILYAEPVPIHLTASNYLYRSFQAAASMNHVELLEWFKNELPDEFDAMLQSGDYAILRAEKIYNYSSLRNWTNTNEVKDRFDGRNLLGFFSGNLENEEDNNIKQEIRADFPPM